jgi:hypothetical protein
MTTFEDMSRFSKTEKVIQDGIETVGTSVQHNFLKERPDESLIKRFYVTNAVEGRPDLIAARVYGLPELDWVLIAFNKARDVLNWPRAGDVIEYPIASVVIPDL